VRGSAHHCTAAVIKCSIEPVSFTDESVVEGPGAPLLTVAANQRRDGLVYLRLPSALAPRSWQLHPEMPNTGFWDKQEAGLFGG